MNNRMEYVANVEREEKINVGLNVQLDMLIRQSCPCKYVLTYRFTLIQIKIIHFHVCRCVLHNMLVMKFFWSCLVRS